MDVLGENIIQYLGFSFLACIILLFLNYARQLVVVPETHEVPALSASLAHGNCIICLSSLTPTNSRCSWWKSVQYCSPKCKLIHWREERKKECQTLNESAIAATGSLVGKSEQQSNSEDCADPNPFSSQDGLSISKSAPENHNDVQRSTDLDRSLNEQIGSWLFGRPLYEWNNPIQNMVEDFQQAKNASEEIFQVRTKAKMACHDKFAPNSLVNEVKVEVSAEPEEPVSIDNWFSHNSSTCSTPTITRCSRCISMYHCSDNCPRKHCISGHSETCEPFSKPATAASRPKYPLQMHSLVNCNFPPYEIDTNKCDIQEGTSHNQFGIKTEKQFTDDSINEVVNLTETKKKGEDGANRNSSYFNNSLKESDNSATTKKNLQNLDGTVSKTIQQNSDEITEVSGKRHKQTISHEKMFSSNPNANTPTDFEARMLTRDARKTKQVDEHRSPFRAKLSKLLNFTKKPSYNLEKSVHDVLEEQNGKIVMQKIGNKFPQKINRLEKELEKEHIKLQNLERMKEEVVKENKELKTKQQDMAKELEHLRQQKEEKVLKDIDATNCVEFSSLELSKATNSFDKKRMIGQGGYGSVYRGVLHCTTVAIKVLHTGGKQGEREFHKEVEVLRTVRLPNIVTFLGGCSQIKALVYEFIPNGSLDNYLSTSAHRKLLYWKAQIEIASNICSALVFLHSTKPHGIAHGDLKPANILLDSNYQGKLSDFGMSRQLVKAGDTITPHHLTEQPKGTLAYIDPEYLQTGEMNPQCDVYSFGIILLQLVTGKPATGICKSVQEALKIQGLYKEIDVAAKWPTEKAIKMIKLGLRCCNSTRKNRPNSIDVWNEIESLKQNASR